MANLLGWRHLHAALISLMGASCSASHPPQPAAPKADRQEFVEGHEIYEAAIHRGRLWLNTLGRHLWEMDPFTGKLTRWTFPSSVGHLQQLPSGRLVALGKQSAQRGEQTTPSEIGHLWRWVDGQWKPQVFSGFDEPVLGLVEQGETVGLVSRSAVRFVAPDGTMKRVNLTPPIKHLVVAKAQTAPDTLFVGGPDVDVIPGGLSKIDLRTGALRQLDVGPIAALHADPDRPGCVLAAVTVQHWSVWGWGGVARVCGEQFEWLFREIPERSDPSPDLHRMAVPQGEHLSFHGVASFCPTPEGLIVQGHRLWRVVGDQAERLSPPEFRAVAGLNLSSQFAGALQLQTTPRSEQQESGGALQLLCHREEVFSKPFLKR